MCDFLKKQDIIKGIKLNIYFAINKNADEILKKISYSKDTEKIKEYLYNIKELCIEGLKYD